MFARNSLAFLTARERSESSAFVRLSSLLFFEGGRANGRLDGVSLCRHYKLIIIALDAIRTMYKIRPRNKTRSLSLSPLLPPPSLC